MTTEDEETSEARGAGQDAPVGSWGEEAVRLLGAFSGWAAQQGAGAHRHADEAVRHTCEELHRFAEGLEDHLATGAPECTWCPVCRAVHVVRTVSPEVRTHLTSAAVSLARAAAALLATAPQAAAGPGDPGAAESSGRSARRDEGDERVQRIRLDDDPDPDPA